jgi:hypothetical protein
LAVDPFHVVQAANRVINLVTSAVLGHASIVLTADTYVWVLPEVAHQAARETTRLVLNAASALGRQLGG